MQTIAKAFPRQTLTAFCLALTVWVSTVHGANAPLQRPADDIARDADRKPDEMVKFAQIKPGQTVVDYIPGKGYFTRVFAAAVGPEGTVYAVVPKFLAEKFKDKLPASVSLEPGYTNVHDTISDGATLNVPAKADVVWTSQNYHDVHNGAGPEATAQINKAVFDALKPGGYFVVIDHAANAGEDAAAMTKMHRIDKAIVIKEVTAAGFVLDGESTVLHNPADAHDKAVFDPAIRGKTDQFALRFKKPAM